MGVQDRVCPVIARLEGFEPTPPGSELGARYAGARQSIRWQDVDIRLGIGGSPQSLGKRKAERIDIVATSS